MQQVFLGKNASCAFGLQYVIMLMMRETSKESGIFLSYTKNQLYSQFCVFVHVVHFCGFCCMYSMYGGVRVLVWCLSILCFLHACKREYLLLPFHPSLFPVHGFVWCLRRHKCFFYLPGICNLSHWGRGCPECAVCFCVCTVQYMYYHLKYACV